MNPAERTQQLQILAERIRQHRLVGPCSLLLDLLGPLSFLASQTAMFFQPLMPLARWRSYLAALTDEPGWNELRQMLDEPEAFKQ